MHGIELANPGVGQYRRHQADRGDQEATAQRQPPGDDDRGLRALIATLNARDDRQPHQASHHGHAQGLGEQKGKCLPLSGPDRLERAELDEPIEDQGVEGLGHHDQSDEKPQQGRGPER